MSATEQLKIDSRAQKDRVVISLDGELDMASAPLLQAALEDAERARDSALVIDLERLRFMDSTGLRTILWARERWQSQGRELALTTGSSQVQRLLSVSGVRDQLRVVSTPDALLV
ncbi:MAG: STAS domain-containing protein [Solirubrobacteraceae bacterium]